MFRFFIFKKYIYYFKRYYPFGEHLSQNPLPLLRSRCENTCLIWCGRKAWSRTRPDQAIAKHNNKQEPDRLAGHLSGWLVVWWCAIVVSVISDRAQNNRTTCSCCALQVAPTPTPPPHRPPLNHLAWVRIISSCLSRLGLRLFGQRSLQCQDNSPHPPTHSASSRPH